MRVADLLAGVTLAALGIPEVLGYSRIAGMPVVTGLYTLLLPMAVFAVLGSSRHLVVGADSATAAMMAAALIPLATPASPHYVALAGLVALLAAVQLLAARLIRLGFLANFLSRTALIGFLTGVGLQVAIGQLPGMLGIAAEGHGTIRTLRATFAGLGQVNLPDLAVSTAVLAVVLGLRAINRRIPAALLAVIGAIVAARLLDLSAHGVRVLGPIPRGLPTPRLPDLSAHDAMAVAGVSAAIFVVILAQSSATARAYAARYDEPFDENRDLVGLGAANAVAGFTGTFVVNGSPTKTQMVDSAGGRSQSAQLTTSVVVLLVLLFLTGPLASLPLAVLAAIVFVIGVELIDVRGMRKAYAQRRDEFAIAVLTAVGVVVLGVEQGILLAVAASIVDHLRTSYAPRNTILVREGPRLVSVPATPQRRTTDGLVVYRFAATLYYANAQRLIDAVNQITAAQPDLRWFCLDCTAVADVDITAAEALRHVEDRLTRAGARLSISGASPLVRAELGRSGITQLIGEGAMFDTPDDAVAQLATSRPDAASYSDTG